MKRRLALLLVASLAAEAAPGSWHVDLGSLHLVVPGRETAARPAVPPELARGRYLQAVRWQFRQTAQPRLRAWLCHPQRCVELQHNSGRTSGLAGLDAGQPLHLRFLLPAGASALWLEDMQLLVEYR